MQVEPMKVEPMNVRCSVTDVQRNQRHIHILVEVKLLKLILK